MRQQKLFRRNMTIKTCYNRVVIRRAVTAQLGKRYQPSMRTIGCCQDTTASSLTLPVIMPLNHHALASASCSNRAYDNRHHRSQQSQTQASKHPNLHPTWNISPFSSTLATSQCTLIITTPHPTLTDNHPTPHFPIYPLFYPPSQHTPLPNQPPHPQDLHLTPQLLLPAAGTAPAPYPSMTSTY